MSSMKKTKSLRNCKKKDSNKGKWDSIWFQQDKKQVA